MKGEELDRVSEALFMLQAPARNFRRWVLTRFCGRVPEAEMNPTIGFARRPPTPSFPLGIYKLLRSITVPASTRSRQIHRRRRRLHLE